MSKPRPVAILQSDYFSDLDSVTVCPLTTEGIESPLLRIPIEPDGGNGLRVPSWLMVDKIVTVPKHRLRTQTGRLDNLSMARLTDAAILFLGLLENPDKPNQ